MNERLSGLFLFRESGHRDGVFYIFLGCCLLTFYCLSHLPMITVNVLECSAYVYILFFDRIFRQAHYHAQGGRQPDDYCGHYHLPEPLRRRPWPFGPSGLCAGIGS